MFIKFILPPVVSAPCTHEYQVHPILGGVCECDSLSVVALSTVEVFPAGESRVLDAFFVDNVVLTDVRLLTLVDAVVSLVQGLGLLEVTADAAVVNEATHSLVDDFLLGLKHVVAFFAETHTLENCSAGHFSNSIKAIVTNNYIISV